MIEFFAIFWSGVLIGYAITAFFASKNNIEQEKRMIKMQDMLIKASKNDTPKDPNTGRFISHKRYKELYGDD